MKSDSLFYTFFQTLPEALFMLSGEDSTNAAAYRFQSIEVKDHAFRLDGVLALPDLAACIFSWKCSTNAINASIRGFLPK